MANLRLLSSLVIGLLLVSSSYQTDATDSTTTQSVDTTVTTTQAAEGTSTTTQGDTGTTGTTETAGTGTTATGGPTVATTTQSGDGATTTEGPTQAPQSTVLPDVTVQTLMFGLSKCDDQICTYQFDSPGNSASVLATDSSIVDSDKIQYADLQTQANKVDKNIAQANKDAQKKLSDLQTMLNNIQSNLDQINTNIGLIKDQQNAARSKLISVESYINSVSSATSSCLYQQCLKPTTPAPPTTTPTPAPTTTADPCIAFKTGCPADHQTCALGAGNKPYCTYCPGNTDGYTHCSTVACTATPTQFNFKTDGTPTDFFTYGYNYTSPNSTFIPASSNCQYQFTGFLKASGDLNLNCLQDGNVKMTIQSSALTQEFSAGWTLRILNGVLAKAGNPIIILQSTGQSNSYCELQLVTNATTSTTVELSEKKNNGFFGWLMGY